MYCGTPLSDKLKVLLDELNCTSILSKFAPLEVKLFTLYLLLKSIIVHLSEVIYA